MIIREAIYCSNFYFKCRILAILFSMPENISLFNEIRNFLIEVNNINRMNGSVLPLYYVSNKNSCEPQLHNQIKDQCEHFREKFLESSQIRKAKVHGFYPTYQVYSMSNLDLSSNGDLFHEPFVCYIVSRANERKGVGIKTIFSK